MGFNAYYIIYTEGLVVSPAGYCPGAEDMLFPITCTTMNWEAAALSCRKQDRDKDEETTETRPDFYPTVGENKNTKINKNK